MNVTFETTQGIRLEMNAGRAGIMIYVPRSDNREHYEIVHEEIDNLVWWVVRAKEIIEEARKKNA